MMTAETDPIEAARKFRTWSFKIHGGDTPEEIARKASLVPDTHQFFGAKYFDIEGKHTLVMMFTYRHDYSIDELLDGPRICFMGMQEIK